MRQLESHPAACIFPMLDAESHKALCDDIRANGQREDIVLLDGRILDGRNRYKACIDIGVEPQWCELEECKDPVAFVLSKNLHRRHLEKSQRAMVAAKVRQLYDDAAKERQVAQASRGKEGGRGKKKETLVEDFPQGNSSGKARDLAAAPFDISGKLVDDATAVLKFGSPELNAAVESGQVSVSKAAKVAKASPKEIQMDEVTQKPPRKKKKQSEQKGGVLDKLKALWKEATQVERSEFIEWTETA